MNETHTKAVSIPLLTFRQGSNNFYDSNFSVPLNFKPNARGLYNVQINEVIFHNNEEVLNKDNDWIKYTVYWTDEEYVKDPATGVVTHNHPPTSIVYKPKSNILSTQRAPNDKKFIDVLNMDASIMDKGAFVNNRTVDDGDALTDISVSLYVPEVDKSDKKETGKSDDKFTQLQDYMVMRVELEGPTTADIVKKITIQASNNFLYMFGNLFNEWTGTSLPEYFTFNAGDACAEEDQLVKYFELHNLRRSGPFVYVVDTNINTPVKTINENGQTYNVMARSYNTATYHNEIIQCNSTMTGTVKDLTNLRIRILNDFMEPLNIHNPVYINLTVSNSD